jgi:hypothetical protein
MDGSAAGQRATLLRRRQVQIRESSATVRVPNCRELWIGEPIETGGGMNKMYSKKLNPI